MPTRRALLIGIDKYQHVRKLQGCENDVRDLSALLQTQFAFTHCRTLLGEQATSEAMRAALHQLIDEAQQDDVVLFYFAGHGSQMKDVDGDEQSGFDNTLVPFESIHDPEQPELNTDISDDEIRALLDALAAKTENVTVIVDACHSGTVTRGVETLVTGVRSVAPYVGPLPSRVASRTRGITRATGAPYTLMASCRDAELAVEIAWPQPDGTLRHHGAFSYYLIARLRSLTSTPTVRELFERVAADLYDGIGGRQRPQLEGNFNRRLFGLDTDITMPFLRLLTPADLDGRLTLAGGHTLGVHVDARVAVYPPDTMRTDGATPLARGTVVEVRAVESTLLLDAAATRPAIPLSARAVVESAPASPLRRPIRLAPVPTEQVRGAMLTTLEEAHALMRTLLAGDPTLWLVETPTPSALTVCFWPPGAEGGAWRWAVTAADGLPVAPLHALEHAAKVHRNCQVLSRQWLVMRVANAAESSVLRKGGVTVEFLTAPKAHEPFTVAAPGADALPVVRDGTMPYALRVRNDHAKPVFVTLIDCALEGSVKQVFPPNDAASETAVPRGGVFEIFTQPTMLRGYQLPDAYPWAAADALPARDEGIASLRLFVTEQPVDFQFLCTTETTRSSAVAPSLPSFMAEQLGVALPVTRGTVDLSSPADTDWTAIDVRFVVRREPPTVPSTPS